MKKIKYLLIISLFVSIFLRDIKQVKAHEDYLPMMCNDAYEVDTIGSNGELLKKACYASFDLAKKTMQQSGPDAVVRHGSSYSPTKIIAMQRGGVAYSYARRSGSHVMPIKGYQNMASTYISNYRQMEYWDTISYNGAGDGRVYMTITGFDGLVSLKEVDLVPRKWIELGKAIYLGGYDLTAEKESPYLVVPKRTFYTAKQNGNYRDLVMTAYSGWALNGDIPHKVAEIAIGPAPDWMHNNVAYYSYDGIHFFSEGSFIHQIGTYYNYYQWLPLRSKSTISAEKLNQFIAHEVANKQSVMTNSGQIFIDNQNKYGVNALMVFAQACIESAFGTSSYAINRYNLFGVNAIDSDPNQADVYRNIEHSISEQMAYQLRNGYMYTRNTISYYGDHFGNKGSGIAVKYASSPYYGESIAAMAYKVDKFAAGLNGKLVDYNTVQLGLFNKQNVPVMSFTKSNVLYTSSFINNYQQNAIANIIGEENGWYKVQSVNYLDGQESMSLAGKSLLTYNWQTNIGWVQKNYLIKLNNARVSLTSQWIHDQVGYWLRRADGTYPKACFETVDNIRYYFNDQGYMVIGWQNISGKWYYFNSSGAMLSNWQLIDNQWYYLNSSGQMMIGWQFINGCWYYLYGSGQMAKGWQFIGNRWYYLDNSGQMRTGWQLINNQWYYLNGSGQMMIGWQFIGNRWYYLDNSGQMRTGWQLINNQWYYLNGSGQMMIGWQLINNQWYYLYGSGQMAKGWVLIDNQWYYFNLSGIMLRNTSVSGYTLGPSGAMI